MSELVSVLRLFRTLILRPLRKDLLRSLLTVIAVALGVAVVIAIDLAGSAAAGSFESSLTTVAGKTDLEVIANGGIDEPWIGKLAGLPVNARFSPEMEAATKIAPAGFVTVYGIDMVGEAAAAKKVEQLKACDTDASPAITTTRLAQLLPHRFLIGARPFCVAKTIESKGGDFIVIDIADLQYALSRYGKLDRIDVFLSPGQSIEAAEAAMRATLPAGYEISRPGTRSAENQKMLGAFRWNLRILSYIALVVGAFLIYNTISTSVIRRRAEIGILRALGTSRNAIFAMFLGEGAFIGLVGAALGILAGRLLAISMVSLISSTVEALYESSSPGPIHLGLLPALTGLSAGLGMALVSAWGPAREAMQVAPSEAMSRGSREARVRRHSGRNLLIAIICGAAAYAMSFAGPIGGKPIFGYAASLLSVAAAAAITPFVIVQLDRLLRPTLRRVFQAEGMLGGRSLTASLGRTSVVVAALATGIAMMASVGIMVGSFRETVINWLDAQLRADIYIAAAGPQAAGEYAPIPAEAVAAARRIPGIQDVDVFSAIDLHYQGQRATFAAGDLDIQRRHGRITFASGDRDPILKSLPHQDRAVVSEPFAQKHHVRVGDRLRLPVGPNQIALTVAGIYYDYSSEQGYVIVDRSTLLKYLPNEPATNIGLYIAPGFNHASVLRAVQQGLSNFPLAIAPNEELRRGAMTVFDRTFAVTWALEGIAILVAVLGAANALLAMVLDRRREFGMLRYLGAASGQIRRMILLEAGLIGFFALVVGGALGLVLSRLLIFVINKQSFGWTIQFHPPGLMLAGAMLLIWAVTVLAGLYPARVAARLKPIEVIHED
jgi:putative ABC transport system permease protein